nr:immunoglobulin light chain junction region [Macaca mulatta]MOX47839.1 immunoglobulin light chain junction region [Macaca mulatta]MOX48366.1 immunoglobulin light chain junction region [Macaca mulatta]MOX48395.1 immunoglobulin light chain junction region [Macaca mulatta]MOX49307.1 immunoglobulin light chain junction region [Macaca mulatta]
CLQYVSAPFTF